VAVVMTEAARQFVTPLSLEVASLGKVYTSLFEEPMAHISLPAKADVMVVAPATANTIAKFALGIADDLLSTCFLVFQGKTIIAPSMNWKMYEDRTVRKNLDTLASFGVLQVGPEPGALACGEEGTGRMSEPAEIVEAVKSLLPEKDLSGERIVVTAGPTREYLDPVRFISNRSSGKMGYSLARAARGRGAEVTLISGPTCLKIPYGLEFVGVETASEMMEAVVRAVADRATLLIMAAAVADFSPKAKSEEKIAKDGEMALALRPTPDIVSAVSSHADRPFVIGFAAETGRHPGRAAAKMKRKEMDMIVFNDVTEPGAGFDVDTNRVEIIDRKGRRKLGLMGKDEVANAILDRFIEIRA
jgi:phosphopantothenoylcysteine decarboxylase/phosphopantothenate--cysteine ligase